LVTDVATTIKATVEITVERRCVIGKRYRDRAMSQRNSRIKLDVSDPG